VYRQALEIENPVPQANNCHPGSSGRMVSGQRSKNLNNTPLGNCTGDARKTFVPRKSGGAEPGISSKYRFTSIVMPNAKLLSELCNCSFWQASPKGEVHGSRRPWEFPGIPIKNKFDIF